MLQRSLTQQMVMSCLLYSWIEPQSSAQIEHLSQACQSNTQVKPLLLAAHVIIAAAAARQRLNATDKKCSEIL